MLNHILLIKLKNQKDATKFIKKFNKLKKSIPQIKELEIKENIYLKRKANYDLYVKLVFDNEEDFETYLFHDDHIKFVKNVVEKYAESRVAIDLNY